VLERAKNYGLMNGVTIALFIDGLRSIASFARSDRDYTTAEIAGLERSFEELHRAAAKLGDLSEEDRLALKDLSLRLTH
jgi:LuxR family transcriptional regulator, quorum-sensing system regulator SdiA